MDIANAAFLLKLPCDKVILNERKCSGGDKNLFLRRSDFSEGGVET